MMDSSSNSNSSSFTPPFDNESDLVVVAEEQHNEGNTNKTDQAASMTKTSPNTEDDEPALDRTLLTDYRSLFYQSMSRPFTKINANKAPPAKKAEAKEEEQVPPTVEETPPVEEAPASPAKQETAPVEEAPGLHTPLPSNPPKKEAPPSDLLETAAAKEEGKVPSPPTAQEAPSDEDRLVEEANDEEPLPSPAPKPEREEEQTSLPSEVLDTTAAKKEEHAASPAEEEQALRPPSGLSENAAANVQEQNPPAPEEKQTPSPPPSSLVEPPTTVHINLDDDCDLSTVASQTIIPTPSGSPRDSPLGKSLLSLKVDDATVSEDMFKAMELDDEDPLLQLSPRASSSNSKQESLSRKEAPTKATNKEPVSQESIIGTTKEDSLAAWQVDPKTYVAVGKSLLQSFQQPRGTSLKARLLKALPKRRVHQVAGLVLLALLVISAGLYGRKRVDPQGLAQHVGVGGDNTIPEALVDEDGFQKPGAPTSTEADSGSFEAVTHQKDEKLEESNPEGSDAEGDSSEAETDADEVEEANADEPDQDLEDGETTEEALLQNDDDVDEDEDYLIVNASSLLVEEHSNSATLPPRTANQNATQQLTMVATTVKEECRSPFDIFGSCSPYMIELHEFFGSLPTFCQVLTALVLALVNIVIFVVICMCRSKRPKEAQEITPAAEEAAEPAQEAVVPLPKEEKAVDAVESESTSSSGLLEQIDTANYTYLRKQDLQLELRSRGCKVSGNKGELIERLVQNYQEELDGLSYRELQHKLKGAGLKQTGKKEDLIYRLLEAGF